MSPVSFVDTRWSVINPPPEPISISKDGKILKMKTRPESDWWHTPTIDSSSGTVYGLKTDLTKQGLTASVELSIDYVDQVSDRDQAALFLQLGTYLWVKIGIELDEGGLYAGVVVTNGYSDWSIRPAFEASSIPKRFTLTLQDRSLKVYFDKVMSREVTAFGTGEEKEAFVGVMACSPKGGGREATFTDFEVAEGVSAP